MHLLAKILLGLLGLVLTVSLVVVLAVIFLVDPDDYREQIAATVESQTGRSMQIEGPLGLKKFPCCAITLGRTSLGNPDGFEAPNFASLDAAALELRVWPLLTRREVVIGRVMLEGLDVNLVRLADGRTNWDFGGAADAAAAPGTDSPADAPALSLSAIAGVDISRSRIAWQDRVTGDDYLLENLELKTGAISPDRPFDVRGSLRFTDRATAMLGEIELRATALADLEAGRISLSELRSSAELSGPELPVQSLQLELQSASLELDAGEEQATTITMPAFTATVGLLGLPELAERLDLRLESGPATLRLGGDTTTVELATLVADYEAAGLELPAIQSLSGRMNSSEVRAVIAADTRLTAAMLETTLSVNGRDLPGGKADINARLQRLEFAADSATGRFADLQADVRGAGLNATLNGQGSFGGTNADARGTLALEPFSPRELLSALGEEVPETADPTVLAALSGSANWFLRGETAGLREIDFRLDDTRLTGSLEQGGGERPLISFALKLDEIDLDRYLAPEQDGRGRPAGDEAGPSELPFELIRELRLDGQAEIAALKVAGVRLSAVRLTMRADEGVLRLDPTRATLYGGTYEGSVVLDASGEQGRLTLNQQLAGVQAAPLLTDLADVSQLSGVLGLNLSGTASGRTDQDLIRNLRGNLALDVVDGYLEGMDLWYEIRRARSLIRREAPAARTGPNRTPINRLELAGQMQDGVLSSDQLNLQIPFVQLSGRGGLDLLSRGLDYQLQARISGSPEGPDGAELADLRNVSIPLTIGGNLDSPSIGVDMAGLVRGAATEALRERGSRALDRILGERDSDQPATSDEEQPEGEQAAPDEESPRDMGRRLLRELLP